MCFNRYILRRHGFGDFLIPALKGITFSCRVVRGGNFCTVVLCNGCNLTSAVGIKGYCILIDFPLCFNRYILRRHGFGDFLIPALKGITFSCRVVRGGNFCTVVLCNGCNLTSAVGIKGYCVLIDFPLCFNRYILRRHGFGDFLIPALKGITFSCRVVRGGNFCTVVLCNGCNLTSAVGIKGYCVLINCPSGVQLQFPGHPVVKVPRLCEGAVRIPAVKGVPRFGGIIRLGNGRIQFVQHFDRPCHRTAARVEIDHTRGGLRPLCVQCNTHILIIRTCAFTVAVPVAFAAHKSIIPTKENIALALGHRHVAELLAVCNLYRFCYHLAAACGVKGDCVLIGVPHRIERQRLVLRINVFKAIHLFAAVNG